MTIESGSESFVFAFVIITKIFLISTIGFISRKTNLINETTVKSLAKVIVTVLMPCLIFSKLIMGFNKTLLPLWWALPIIGALFSIISISVSSLFFIKKISDKKPLLAISGIQNAGYLILPFGIFLFPKSQDEFISYLIMFIIGFDIVLWSLGKYLITDNHSSKKISIKDFISPPLVASAFTLALVAIGLSNYIPNEIVDSFETVGKATIPIAMIILGASLAEIKISKKLIEDSMIDIIKVLSVKFLLIPTITLAILLIFDVNSFSVVLATLLLLESCSPPATNLLVQIKNYGGEANSSGVIIFISYIVSIIAVPAWLVIFWWLT